MNPNLVTTEIEQSASIITEVTQLPAVNTVVEESKTLQTVVDEDKTPIQTVVEENTSNIVSLINQPTVQVTSVNGKTGDVEVDSEVSEFKPGKYYKRGTLTTYNGSAYIAKNDITPTTFNLADWEGVGGVQSDWNVTLSSDPSFIKNKPNLSTYATKTELNTKAPLSHTHTIAQVTNLQTTLDGKQAKLPTGANNQFLSHNASGLLWSSSHAQATWTTGTNTTPTTIAPSVLKATVQAHQIQPNWNATSGKGAILNKPTIPQVDTAKKFLSNVEVDSSPDEQNLILTKEAINGTTEEVRVDLAEFIGSLNIPIQPKPIYGMVRGRVGGSAQTMGARVTVDMVWDESRKIEQNIQFLGSTNSNAWLIPEDGIYTLTASAESVDVANPFTIFFQRKTVDGTWNEISPESPNSYPANGRGCLVSTTQHLRKGELVNVRVVNLSDGPTRIGEHNHRGHFQCYYTITRVATLGMDTQVSARPHNRLVKEVSLSGGKSATGAGQKTLGVGFEIPEEFTGRKFKIDWSFTYDRPGASGNSVISTLEFQHREWARSLSTHINQKNLGNHNAISYHTHFRDTTIHNGDTRADIIEILIIDRDKTLNESGRDLVLHGVGARAILETID